MFFNADRNIKIREVEIGENLTYEDKEKIRELKLSK